MLVQIDQRWFMKLLALSAAAALFLTVVALPAPIYAQSSNASGKASQTDPGGRASKTGSTSKKQ
jgi:hypothetical protein